MKGFIPKKTYKTKCRDRQNKAYQGREVGGKGRGRGNLNSHEHVRSAQPEPTQCPAAGTREWTQSTSVRKGKAKKMGGGTTKKGTDQ